MKDGRVVSISHQPLPSGGWLTTHDDITEIRKIEGRIAHMALHDALTGLPNRVLLRQRIEAALPAAHRGQPFAVHCLDLDHFKSVNDTLGHPVGDELLKQATRRLTRCVRRLDTVARLGGDEFAIIQSGVDSADVATRLAQRICDALKQPFDISGHQVLIDVSIGIALAPQDGTDPDELLKNADLALYRAKGDGRGVYRYFESEMNAMMQERRRLEMALRTGVKEGQFELHYQPIVNVESSAITGFEALLRWNHPERGLVAPGEFLPLAEEIGLIIPLGEWVLREACRQAAAWPGNYRVAVNLSAHQFRSMNLVPTVIGALSTAGLPARRLELEITESALLNDSASTLRTLHMLRGLGVRIAMDDFGTGYSSLSYLRQFPFDKVKIDGSFVKELAEASESLAIVRAITGLGASLGMETTAEGVETEAQLDRIRAEGCSEIQGYFFSPPCPEGELAARFFGDEGQLKSAVGE
jgi:diguanylate cyclase (GGDEF)-like protein